MKNGLALITAGFIGGIIALFVSNYSVKNSEIENYNVSPRAILASNTSPTTPFNFVKAAQIATPVVAQVTVQESANMAQQRLNNRPSTPFDAFFERDFFRRDFAPRGGSGSGVVVSEDGYLVTNNHVIEGGDIITVVLDGKEYQAKKIGSDPTTDIALIKIEAQGLQAAQFGDSDKLQVGEWVAAVGNPFNYLTSTVTAGIVGAKGRDINILENSKAIEEFIQTDAAINPGNSGGALVNSDGLLVGINTAIATPTGVYAGYGFAIPSNLVKRTIKDLKENGSIERGRLGIEGRTLDETIKEENKLSLSKGFYVDKLVKGSGAQYSGVLPGDIIVGANGKVVERFEDLLNVVERAKVGDAIELDIVRKNKKMKIPVHIRRGI